MMEGHNNFSLLLGSPALGILQLAGLMSIKMEIRFLVGLLTLQVMPRLGDIRLSLGKMEWQAYIEW